MFGMGYNSVLIEISDYYDFDMNSVYFKDIFNHKHESSHR